MLGLVAAYYCGSEGPREYKSQQIPGFQLSSVQVLFRHGARTSLQDIACFHAHAEYTCLQESTFSLSGGVESLLLKQYPGGCERGQLLTSAAEQLKRVANWVRETYPRHFQVAGDLSFRSTDLQRTLASMLYLKDFLFPQVKDIQVSVDEYSDDALASNFQTARSLQLQDEFVNSTAHKQVLASEEYRQCRELWEKEIGTEYVPVAMDCLLSAHCANITLPRGLVYSESLLECVVNVEVRDRKAFFGQSDTDFKSRGLEMSLLRIQPLIDEINKRLDAGQSGLMASHDTTIVLLLQGLGGLWDGNWPKYAETLVLERHVSLTDKQKTVTRVVRDGVAISTLQQDSLISHDSVLEDNQWLVA